MFKKANYLPNAFSPNGDGTNYTFPGIGFVNGMFDFRLQIYDRWGGLIFTTTDPHFEWAGVRPDGNTMLRKGVYAYELIYKTSRGELHERQD